MKHYLFLLVSFPLLLALAACTPNIGSDNYSLGSVGDVNTTVSGTVESVREVQVEGDNQDVGMLVGAASGAVAGSAIGGGSRVPILGGILGATAGGAAGKAAGRNVGTQRALEYVIRTDDGRSLSVIQGTDVVFSVGSRVRLVNGRRARLIAE